MQVTRIALLLLIAGAVAVVDLVFVETYILYQTDGGHEAVEEAIRTSPRHSAAYAYCNVLTFPAARFTWHTLATNDAIETEWIRTGGGALSLIGIFVNAVLYAFLIAWGWNALRSAWRVGPMKRPG